MILKIRTRMIISFSAIVLFTIALLSLSANIILENQFRDYVMKKQEQKNISMLKTVAGSYVPGKKEWNTDYLENICIAALESDMILKIKDASGQVIWDATHHDNERCEEILDKMSSNIHLFFPGTQGEYMEKTYPVEINGETIAFMTIGYYGPYFFTDSDVNFLNTINRLLLMTGGISLLLSILMATIWATRFSKPVSAASEAANKIERGDYKVRLSEKTNTRELNSLSESINNLSAALETQELLRKRLTSDVAHELRTPVTTLQSHLEAFIDGVWEPDQNRLKGLHEETVRLGNMINDLEKLSRYDYEAKLDLTDFDLRDILQSIKEMYSIKFTESRKILKVDSEPLQFTGDKDRIKQALINLLDNALKYTDENDQIEIRAFREENSNIIEVTDTGAGIPEEHLPYIFERFYRADNSRNRSTGGSGIGLSIVKSIVEAHGGAITVKSKPGEGTCFKITLPSNM